MANKKLNEKLKPYASAVLSNFLTAGIVTVDNHCIISAYNTTFPVSYNFGVAAFRGNKQLFHAYLGRMLYKQKFGYANLIGFTPSPNINGNITRNSEWKLM